jgi:hypothetical protein
MNREWHVQYQYLLMEIAHAVNALRNGNNDETIVALCNNTIAKNCAKLVDLQDSSIHLLEPSIIARRKQWQSFIDGK